MQQKQDVKARFYESEEVIFECELSKKQICTGCLTYCKSTNMFQSLKIILIASECVPFVKTGGLADVVGALPKSLKALGHDVSVILPKYQKIDTEKFSLEKTQENMGVWMGENIQEWCSVDETTIGDDIPVYFIEYWKYFNREGLYNDKRNRDYGG